MPTSFAVPTTYYPDGTWQTWTNATYVTSSTNAIQTQVWIDWNTTAGTTTAFTMNTGPTPEQRAAADERFRKARAEQEAARERAEELLAEVISISDYTAWKARRWIKVEGSDGHEYRIYRGVSGNVQEWVDGEHVATWCAHPRDCPEADVHIAQVLTLRHDVPAFKAVANPHYRRRAA